MKHTLAAAVLALMVVLPFNHAAPPPPAPPNRVVHPSNTGPGPTLPDETGLAFNCGPVTQADSTEQQECWQITCQEDMSCWDCRSMGNLICGPDNDQVVPAGDYNN